MKYIALLRGINVGGNNKISMKDLKFQLEKLGFKSVITYINSGNVIFESDETDEKILREMFRNLIKSYFCLDIHTFIINELNYKKVLSNKPKFWGGRKEYRHDVGFVLEPTLPEDVLNAVGKLKSSFENAAIVNNAIFISLSLKDYSKTSWSKLTKTKLYKSVTIRNFNTANKLLELLDIE